MSVEGELAAALRAVKAKLIRELHSGGLTRFQTWRLRGLVRSVDEVFVDATDKVLEIVRSKAPEEFKAGGSAAIAELSKTAAEAVGAAAWGKFAASFNSVSAEAVFGLLAFRADLVVGIAAEAARAATAELQLGILRGSTVGEVAEKLAGGPVGPRSIRLPGGRSVVQTAYSRSVVVARTELHRAYMAGRMEACRAAESRWRGLFEVWKVWVPVVDSRTRPGHLAMKSHPPVKLSDKFRVWADSPSSAELMDRPGDPSAHAENVVNCRCVTVERAFPAGSKQADVARVMGR